MSGLGGWVQVEPNPITVLIGVQPFIKINDDALTASPTLGNVVIVACSIYIIIMLKEGNGIRDLIWKRLFEVALKFENTFPVLISYEA